MKKIIAIDIGNTETTVGIGNKEGWDSYRFTTRDANTSDELLALFNSTFNLDFDTKNQISGSIICSVVPQVTNNMFQAVEKYLESAPIVVGPGIKTGLKVNIDNPKELGPDRIANSVAGYKIAKSDVLIVDLGTATTFDILVSNTYRGGVIAPGISISLNTLTDRASLIPKINLKKIKKVIGIDTNSAVRSGFFWGYAGLIDNIINLIKKETRKSYKVIITGGFSDLFKNSIKTKVVENKDITVKGLIKISKLINR